MGQRPQLGHRTAQTVGSTVALTVLGAGLLAGCGSGGNSAITKIVQAADAQVISAAGQTVAAQPGTVLHAGDELRTGADGDVVLSTGDRKGYLGGQGSYIVRGRGSGLLQRGAFVVDARKGPALSISAGPVTAKVGRSAVRIERGFAVRVGVLAGRAVSVSGDGANGPAQLDVRSLYQVVVAGRGLATATPLALVDDDAERRVVPELVADDRQLTLTANALDSGTEGRALIRVVSFGGISLPQSTAHVSEEALPAAIARATSTTAQTFADHYQQAHGYRAGGGSWGVVARLMGTDATATSRAIDTLLAGVPATGAALAAGPVTGASGGGSGGQQQSNPSPTPNSNRPPQGNNPSPSPTPSSPPPTQNPSPNPVQDLVDTVKGILPPLSQPTAPSSPTDCKLLNLLNC